MKKTNNKFNDEIRKIINLKSINSFEDLINMFIWITIRARNNGNKNTKSLPIVSFIYEQNNREINVLSVNINHKWMGQQDDKDKFLTHSEHLCLEDVKGIGDIKDRKLKLFNSTQPCINCLRKISDFNVAEINYVVEKNMRLKKTEKKLLKGKIFALNQ